MKKISVCTIVLTVLATLLRVLTHIFIIDESGAYSGAGLMFNVWRYSLPAVLALAAVTALVIYFKGKKDVMADGVVRGGRFYSVCMLVLGCAVLADAGIRIGTVIKELTPYVASGTKAMINQLRSIPDVYVVPFAVIAGIYCAVLCFELISGKNTGLSKALGVFAPAYICARAVVLFFESFKY